MTQITLTLECAGVPDGELGPKIKQPMIAMAKDQAQQEGLRLVDDPVWESFFGEDGKRYALKMDWPAETDSSTAVPD